MSEWLLALVEVALVNLVLSGDNAVVIGLAARSLPPEMAKRAVLLGGGAAVALRLALTVPAELLLQVPGLRAGGGLLLAWIAYRLITVDEAEAGGGGAGSVAAAVRMIVIADFSMSLDNVLAVAAVADRSPSPVLILIFGIAVSVPIVLLGGRVVASLMGRLPWLAWVGAGILAFTAAELIVEDKAVDDLVAISGLLRYSIALVFAVGLLLVAWLATRQRSGHSEPA